MSVRWLRQDCVFYGRIAIARLRTVYFLVESGTLFHSLPTRECVRRGCVGPETSMFALQLCGASAGFPGASVFSLGDGFNCARGDKVRQVRP